jgi:hypothetical protein
VALCATAAPSQSAYHLIPGAVPLDRGPDGNTIILAGWESKAARFIDAAHLQYVDDALSYYIKKRLRAPEQQTLYCQPLKAAG